MVSQNPFLGPNPCRYNQLDFKSICFYKSIQIDSESTEVSNEQMVSHAKMTKKRCLRILKIQNVQGPCTPLNTSQLHLEVFPVILKQSNMHISLLRAGYKGKSDQEKGMSENLKFKIFSDPTPLIQVS